MKNTLIKIFLILLSFIVINITTISQCNAQIGVITYTASTCGSSCTTVSVNTTSATLIVIGITAGATISAPTDSKSNTWTLVRTEQANASGARQRVYYCYPCTVGTNHAFTSPSGVTNIHVLAVSGTRTATDPLDQQNGAGHDISSSIASGSITPSANGALVFYQFGGFNPGAAPSLTSGGSGMTLLRTVATGSSHSGGAWYEIQTTATVRNITGTSSSSPHATGIIVSFAVPDVAPTEDIKLLLSEW